MHKSTKTALLLLLVVMLLGLNPGSSFASSQTPVIGTINYSSSPLIAGDQENLTFTLSDSTNTSISRSYWVEMYGVRGGTAYLKASKNVTIPSGNSSALVTFNAAFTSPGQLYTLIKVYSSFGGALLTQRQSTYTNTVHGYWTIKIQLPKNRLAKGTLTLYNAEGIVQMRTTCLGLSQYRNSTTMYQTNGNTPTGVYQGRLDGPYSPPHSYGPYQVINMTAISGAAKTSGRSGIWIHGGDPGTSTIADIYPFRMTNGCIRISNTDQLNLQKKISALIANYHYSTGYIYIEEY